MWMLRTGALLAAFHASGLASIFIVAISKDGVVAVADSRITFSDAATGRAVAFADGLDKIIRFDSAVMAETGQGFIGNERFDEFVRQFAKAAGPIGAGDILPALLEYGGRNLPREDLAVLDKQHLAVAKFEAGKPLLCGYDGRLGCVEKGYIQSSPTDFAALNDKLPAMSALETATSARASMQRYIAANGKSTTMGGEFSAVLLTPVSARQIWALSAPKRAKAEDEFVDLVARKKIPVTLVPPANWAELERLLQ